MASSALELLAALAQAQQNALTIADNHVLHQVAMEYQRLDDVLHGYAANLEAKMAQAIARGEQPSVSWLTTHGQLEQVIAQVEAEQARAAGATLALTEKAKAGAVDLAVEHQTGMLAAQTGVEIFEPSIPAITNMIVNSSKAGAPLTDLFAGLPGQTGQQLRDALIEAMAMGKNPREVTDLIDGFFNMTESRAETIARTEMLGAYREASSEVYNANADIMQGWLWSAATDETTCGECWAMDGTEHSLDEQLDGHPNCRCAMIPVTMTYEQLGLPGVNETSMADKYGTGEEKFAALDEARQLEILGPAKFEAYQNGDISLTDLVGRREDDQWGSMRYERSLSEAMDASIARNDEDWRIGTGFDQPNVGPDGEPYPPPTPAADDPWHALMAPDGGFTIDTETGGPPTTGYAVGTPGFTSITPADEFFAGLPGQEHGLDVMDQWLTENAAYLDANPDAFIGAWHDPEHDEIVLDMVTVVDDRDAAIALGQERDEQAIADLEAISRGDFDNAFIDTGGTGGRAEDAGLVPWDEEYRRDIEQAVGYYQEGTLMGAQDSLSEMVTTGKMDVFPRWGSSTEGYMLEEMVAEARYGPPAETELFRGMTFRDSGIDDKILADLTNGTEFIDAPLTSFSDSARIAQYFADDMGNRYDNDLDRQTNVIMVLAKGAPNFDFDARGVGVDFSGFFPWEQATQKEHLVSGRLKVDRSYRDAGGYLRILVHYAGWFE